jgi:4-amino-4-deoxy-L-arabinose transferase-like glycosyltransferase
MPDKKFLSNSKLFFQDRRKLLSAGLLVFVLALGTFLRFYQLGASGDGNLYYAATVKSMLVSWHNFFFAAFEPGGSLSVDKPPLGFWVQALSAYFLGLNGFALALPNTIAGVLSIFMVYKLVRRPFGPWAGLLAALVLAVMPVAISAERNNTIDGLLVFVLLLAAWAFLQSVYTGKMRWLLLGAVIVGLGFNIKMLQAFLPLPAFYAVYFFGTRQKWWKKILNLALASVILLAVSFSWAVAVDLVPVSNRPYVDSTENNTVMELIFGHNGIERLINLRQGMGLDGGQNRQFTPAPSSGQPGGQLPVPPGGQNLPPGNLPNGDRPLPPGGQGFPQGLGGNDRQNSQITNGGQTGGQGGSMDFGTAGTLRLFTNPLVGEASWLLPFVLGGFIVLVILLARKRPFDGKHAAIILWAGWLLPEAIYFTYSTGLMHAYYLIMLGAPIAALAAMTGWALWEIIQKRKLLGWSLAFLLAGGTIFFQAGVLHGTAATAPQAVGLALALLGIGLVFAVVSRFRARFAPAALSLLLIAMLVAPALWSALTTFNSSPNTALPYAGPATQGSLSLPAAPRTGNGNGNGNARNQSLLDYLLANTAPGTYLLATDRANDAASYILDTGRPVLTFGGFLGEYQEVSVEHLSALAKSGQLRFILSQGAKQYPEIFQWVQQNCKAVDTSNLSGNGIPGGQAANSNLYDCGS